MVEAILHHHAEAKVVILSSLGARNDIEECLRMGAASYLQKPIDPDAMVRVLLAEQLYRAHSLLHNHPYHRE